MKTLVLALVVALSLSVVCGLIFIPILRKIKAKQTILKYVETHKDKNGTPTMGGLFFIIPSVITFFTFGGGGGRIAVVSVVIGLAFMLVGFIDDYIKIILKRNEGLKAYQKIIFQVAIALASGVFVYTNGMTLFHLPFTSQSIELGWVTVPFVGIIFVAITNCVNLTDGLDGLAASTSCTYLISLVVLIILQLYKKEQMYLMVDEYEKLNLLSACLIGGLLGFLAFNSNKASVFMGDTGSLSLGGFLGAVGIFSSNALFIPIIGIMFVVSGISVIVQVAVFKRTKKRVFLMAPIHHHFQLKGYGESRVAFNYSLITAIAGILVLLPYL